MRRLHHTLYVTLVAGIALFSLFCSTAEVQVEAPQYPEPRFPAYLVNPATVEDAMPYARNYVRNDAGFEGLGLGFVKPGQQIAIVVPASAEDSIMEAIERALEERDIKLHILRDYQLAGVSREDARTLAQARVKYTSQEAYMEIANWMEGRWAGFANSEVPKNWLKERRPDLFEKLFPARKELSPRLQKELLKFKMKNQARGLIKYLEQNPHIDGVFWGGGRGTYLKRMLHPMEHKHWGVFTAHSRIEMMSEVTSFPADVWSLIESLTLESLAFADEVQVNDAEGTDFSFKLEPIQAERWARGAYHRGHMFMFPAQATGRFASDVVNYPAITREYLPPEPLVFIDGVVAGTVNHTGFFPRWEWHFKDGRVTEVRGGGVIGEVAREFLEYPGIQEASYPYYESKGYWYMHEGALGTHPKYFRHPDSLAQGRIGYERMRSGIIHWAIGKELVHGPEAAGDSEEWMKFGAETNLPMTHSWHTHNYFTTYKVHLRQADEWLTLLDKGRMTAMDQAEVRALASRYGDPDNLLSEEWIPYVPGINAPGSYEDYAADPYKVAKEVMDKAKDGSYEYLYTRPSGIRQAAAIR